MHRLHLVWSAMLCIGGLSVATFAAETPLESVVALNHKFDDQVDELRDKYETELETAKIDHAAKLESQIRPETSKGQLDNVLALKN